MLTLRSRGQLTSMERLNGQFSAKQEGGEQKLLMHFRAQPAEMTTPSFQSHLREKEITRQEHLEVR